jgi:gliding motility-associated-like protein
MKKHFFTLNFVVLFCVFSSSETVLAQLGFCNGNSGDPIFTEDFGTGTSYGPALPTGTTNYDFVGSNGPQDGEYTVGPNTFAYGWNLPSDHTPGDTNGRCLIVNADFTAGEFYRTTISGLCETTTYEFSSWLINLLPASSCGGSGIPINVRFEIWDNTNSVRLAFGDTGDIFGSNTPNWEEYALVFKTSIAQTSVILKMINNGSGGCGNDLAIDDIVFKSCGDFISISDQVNNSSITICSTNTPFSQTLTITPDNSVFSTHFYQWQKSTDEINWTDIPGENLQTISISGITTSSFYRAKVGETASNLNNALCNVTSDIFQLTVEPISVAPTVECWETATANNATCLWDVTGTQPVQPATACYETASFNNITCAWDVTGVQPAQPTLECWETTSFNSTTCSWETTGTQPTQPTGLECWQAATFNNISCAWDVAGIQPQQPATACYETASFNNATCAWEVRGTQPVIETVLSDRNSIVVITSNTGDFLFSLDGIIFQSDNVFYNVEGGLYTIYIKAKNCNDFITIEYHLFYIPQFFTPNNDGVNDTFIIKGIENYATYEVSIYNRFGKILKRAVNTSFSWDGMYNNNPLPSTDYWYVVIIEDQRHVGHFTLKR